MAGQPSAIVTCGCSATEDALRHGERTHPEPDRCIGCGTPVAPSKPVHRVTYTDWVTEYGITVRNPFKVF